MPYRFKQLALAAFGAIAWGGAGASARAAPTEIPVILATSGGGAFAGKGQQTSLEALSAS